MHKIEDMARSHKRAFALIEGRSRSGGPIGFALRASRIFLVGFIECWRMRATAEKRRCDFAGCFHEVKLHRTEWLELRRCAPELDIDKGSCCDARIGVVNFWCGCGLDNKPLDWPDVGINKGTLRFPRDYVGAFFAESIRRRNITVHFRIRAYSRGEASGVDRGRPEYQRLLRGTKQDENWVIRQFDLLRHHATLMRKGSSACQKP